MKGVQDYCVIDCRVSDKQQLQGGSLDDQELIGQLVARERGLLVAKVFKKQHSATTTDRDDFQEIVDFIKNDSRQIKYYIVKSLDRLTREGYPEYVRLKAELEKIGVQIIDAAGVIQPKKNTLEHLGGSPQYKWSIHSPSEANEMQEAYKGKAEARDILTRLIGASITLVQNGYSVRRPPDGLKNKPVIVKGKNKVIREADLERAPYFQKMFELLSENMDYIEVVERVNAMGFKTNTYRKWDRSDKENPKVVGSKGGKLLTVKQLQRYILQTEYAGINYEKWTKHKPIRLEQFNGIVSIETFNKANRGKIYIKVNEDDSISVLHNYSPWGRTKRLRDNPKYPWKCVLCPFCKSEMLASPSTGKSGAKYDAYHCGGMKDGKRKHIYFRITQADFEKNVCAYLDSLKFDKAFLAGLVLHMTHKYHNREKEILIESSAVSRSVSDLKAELAQKLDAFGLAKNQIVKDMLEGQIVALDAQIKKTESERNKIEINEMSIRAFRQYAGQLMEHPAKILTEADNLHARRSLMTLFFEEVPTYNEILNGTPKLQPLFRLSESYKVDKSQLVTLPGVEPGFSA